MDRYKTHDFRTPTMSSKETKNKSRLYLSALMLLAATAVLSTVTSTGNNVFAQDNSDDESHSNSNNVANSNDAVAEEQDQTEEQKQEQDQTDNNEEEATDQDDADTNSETNTEQQQDSTSSSSSASLTAAPSAAADNPNGNDDNVPGDNPQPDRVGSHDSQTSPEGSAAGGTVTDPTLCTITTNPDCSTTVDANCFGKVIQERAQDHKDEPEEGTLGSHSRDPVPEVPGNETPRQGIGNQNQGTPAAHGAFNSQFEEEDEQNVIDNC